MRIQYLIIIGLLAACSSSPRTGVPPAGAAVVPAETEAKYGYSESNPIKVGGSGDEVKPARQHEYLRSLRGPEGQVVRFHRLGSCCQYETPNGFMGHGFLDIYQVSYDGIPAPVELYLTMYELDNPRAPDGFRFAR